MSNNSEKVLKHSLFSLKASMILTMTIALLSVGIVIFAFFFSNRVIKIIQEKIPFQIILESKNINSLERGKLMNALKNHQSVDIDKTKFVHRDLAAKKLRSKLGNDFLLPLNNQNPLPDIVNVYIKSNYHNFKNLKELEKMIDAYEIVSTVIFPIKISDRLTNLKSKILIISLFISIIFLVLSILLIYNNIRLSIYSSRFNLKVMQLVGATKKFIQKPFLKNSILDGFLAGILSSIILGALLFIILYISFENNKILIDQVFSVFSIIEIGLVFIFIILSGGIISFISHWLVLKKILSLKINLYK